MYWDHGCLRTHKIINIKLLGDVRIVFISIIQTISNIFYKNPFINFLQKYLLSCHNTQNILWTPITHYYIVLLKNVCSLVTIIFSQTTSPFRTWVMMTLHKCLSFLAPLYNPSLSLLCQPFTQTLINFTHFLPPTSLDFKVCSVSVRFSKPSLFTMCLRNVNRLFLIVNISFLVVPIFLRTYLLHLCSVHEYNIPKRAKVLNNSNDS